MMQPNPALLGVVAALLSSVAVAQDKQTATLKFRAIKSFDFVMPTDTWTPVSGTIQLKHPNGDGFLAQRDGLKLMVDTTGTGKPNKEVKGQKGYLTFHSKKGEATFQYAARFVAADKGYKFATSCAMVGTVGGVPIQLFDLDNNGVYNQVGVDGLIIGGGKAASFLSKVISHKGELYSLEVSEDGQTVSTTPFTGERGTIGLAGGFHSRAKLDSAVVVDDAGNSFNLAGAKTMVVPTGRYTIGYGRVSKGSQAASIRAGKMSPLTVKAGQETKLTWGGPVMLEFTHTLAEGKVTVEPANLKYYGKAGEEYFDWLPIGKSPKFTARSTTNGKELGNFLFHSC